MSPQECDQNYMRTALELAKHAQTQDEVPVGALVVKDQQIISTGYNQREQSQKVTQHAEIIALEEACQALGTWRLTGCTLYVTLEPCLMCAGALYQARVSRVVYGCQDPKGGALGSLYSIHQDLRLNHNYEVTQKVYDKESSSLLKNYFSQKRKKRALTSH